MITINGWEKYQHYKKDKPTWVKLYRDLLGKYEWMSLDPVERVALISLWLLAAETGNSIPNDPTWLQHRMSLPRNPDLSALEQAGFISIDTGSRPSLEKVYSKPLYQDRDREETETEKEVRKLSARVREAWTYTVGITDDLTLLEISRTWPEDWIVNACLYTKERRISNTIPYIRKILRDWKKNGGPDDGRTKAGRTNGKLGSKSTGAGSGGTTSGEGEPSKYDAVMQRADTIRIMVEDPKALPGSKAD